MERHDRYHSHNKKVLESLSDGDLIEVPHVGYSHWAVYVGNKEVIHLTTVGNDSLKNIVNPKLVSSCCGGSFDEAIVKKENYWSVVRNVKALKNKTKDSNRRPLEPDTIVANANKEVGRVGYNVFYSNCEHFANWCRYGLKESEQVNFWTQICGWILSVLAAITALFFALKRMIKM